MVIRIISLLYFVALIIVQLYAQPTPVKPALKVSENQRYLIDQYGNPFFWLGGTVWGMSEWMTREDIDLYLDDRKDKGFHVIQICLFWGKRTEDPVNFTTNAPNAYGHKAFEEVNGKVDGAKPLVMEGGNMDNPNDYWDHVDYIVDAVNQRGMYLALLPVWGRRYVNATHRPFSQAVFSEEDMKVYGEFLGERYRKYSHIIWVMGGDVKADDGGDFLEHYRAMAEGIIEGITDKKVKWNEDSELWEYAMMTYHPDGSPFLNSSRWFHEDPWLDFNMIETWQNRDSVYQAVRQDYVLTNPVKPTVMAEPSYEMNGTTRAIHVRRQAFQSFFAGAAGFTYGAFRDSAGNGPLFSPYQGWEKILDLEGAQSLQHVKQFCLDHGWPNWNLTEDIFTNGKGEGELQKVAVITHTGNKCLIYYPDTSFADYDFTSFTSKFENVKVKTLNPARGFYSVESQISLGTKQRGFSPPEDWADTIFIIEK